MSLRAQLRWLTSVWIDLLLYSSVVRGPMFTPAGLIGTVGGNIVAKGEIIITNNFYLSVLFCCPGVASNVESARNFNIANHQAARGGSHFAVKSNIHQVPTKCCHQSLETKMFRI